MKRLLLVLAFVVCLAASLIPTTKAGEIPIGGYCGSQTCVDANPAPDGTYWNPEYDVFHLHQN
jgi:DIM protein